MGNHQDTKAQRSPPVVVPLPPSLDAVATEIVDSAFRVHQALGPGLLESVYETCLTHELRKRGLAVARQIALPIIYDDLVIKNAFRVDLVVAESVVVEIKSAEALLPVHQAQLLSYLRLARKRLGFLINFNVALIKSGLRRIVL
jgi:GxxExxY protein